MSNLSTRQAVIVDRDDLNANVTPEELALFNADGTPYVPTDGAYPVITTATAAATAAKTTTAAEPADNSFVVLKFTEGNTADAVTVAFNGGTARAVKFNGVAVDASSNFTIPATGVAVCWFDGTVLHSITPAPA